VPAGRLDGTTGRLPADGFGGLLCDLKGVHRHFEKCYADCKSF